MTRQPSTPRKLCTFLAASAGLLTLVGCGGDTTGQDMGADLPLPKGTFAELQPLFTRACTFSSCHGSAMKGELLLTGDGAYCNLVGAKQGGTVWPSAKGTFPRRVTPGDRTKSFLYKKLTLTPAEDGVNTTYGTLMPQGGSLAASEIEIFGLWIDKGAKALDDQTGSGSCP